MATVDIDKKIKEEYIREQNTMIGEFLGWKLVCLNPEEPHNPEEGEYKIWNFQKFENGEFVKSDYGGDSWSWGDGDALPFNADWSWLMEAYEKISELCSSCSINNKGCLLAVGGEYPQSEKGCDFYIYKEGITLKESIWLAVVEFIKWYNEKNNQ